MPNLSHCVPPETRSQIVIPARLQSTRLPRKLLLSETGKPLLQHTYESAKAARLPCGVMVATDSLEIAEEVRRFGGRCVMTGAHLTSGTDRVAEVAQNLSETDIIVNVQGDEPELSGACIDSAIRMLTENANLMMTTLATPIRKRAQLLDSACVKVVFDDDGKALYFSRAPIPYVRDWDDRLLEQEPAMFYQHIGLYAYRREFLLRLAAMAPSALERIEGLEQLRVLQAGTPIGVAVVDRPSVGIDTPEDYAAFVRRALDQSERRRAS